MAVWHAALRAMRYIDGLNASAPPGTRPLPNLYGWFPHGEIAVGLFFLISGYVIAKPYVASGSKAVGRPIDFYRRRFRRIYPPYLVMLTLCLLLLASRRGADTVDLLHHYAVAAVYANGLVYSEASPFDPPMWSLEVEIQFYLIAPFLLAIFARWTVPGRRRLIGMVVVLAAMAAASIVDAWHPYDGRYGFGLLAHFYLFLAGILAADWLADQDIVGAPGSLLHDGVFAAGIAVAIPLGLWLARVDARPGGGWRHMLAMALTLAAVLAIFVGGLRGRWMRRALGSRWIALIGTMCFSLYLVHVVVMQILAVAVLPRLRLTSLATIYPVYLGVLLLASLVAGTAFYILIERPVMNRGLVRRRQPPPHRP